jgi:acyl-CoA reductase-like NAD-dependent aldehyde dehydrogenase
VTEQRRLFVGGEWALPTTAEVIEVVSPHSEEVIATAPAAGPEGVDRAVTAAHLGGPASMTTPTDPQTDLPADPHCPPDPARLTED